MRNEQVKANQAKEDVKYKPFLSKYKPATSFNESIVGKENQCQNIETLRTSHTLHEQNQHKSFKQIKHPIRIENYFPENQQEGNHLQFSTLSLDYNHQHQQKLHQIHEEKCILIAQNQQLLKQNQLINHQMESFKRTFSTQIDQLKRQYSAHLEELVAETQKKDENIKFLSIKIKKMQKQCENLKINQELIVKKISPEDINKIYKEINGKIEVIVKNFIDELKNQRMNERVEQLIETFSQELLKLNPRSLERSQKIVKSLFKNESDHEDKYDRLSPIQTKYRSNHNKINTSENKQLGKDRLLLEKSVEKLKNMERSIVICNGNYLQKSILSHTNSKGHENNGNYEDSQYVNGINKERGDCSYERGACSPLNLDRSLVSNLDRSKSKRKKIFQQ